VEYIHKIIWSVQKPVITIKPMAAGRVTAYTPPLRHDYRKLDDLEETAKDIEISLAALEGRSSPN
jgi:hypothetical protein